jgi:hypothetical protein
MLRFEVKFLNQPGLIIELQDTPVGHKYLNLVKDNYSRSKPIYRDRTKYTVDYMISLANQAKQVLGWNWLADTYTVENTARLHKDIEELVGQGFDHVPAEYDDLIHELHFCLHIIQDGTATKARDGWLQLEWYNDQGFDLDRDFPFTTKLNFGDVKFQNPWVGHGPLQLYLEQDFSKISQTCKFHTFVKPGINIVISNFKDFTETDQLVATLAKHDPSFVQLHGEEKIKHYTGYPVIGQVVNLDDLQQVAKASNLEFESVIFNAT